MRIKVKHKIDEADETRQAAKKAKTGDKLPESQSTPEAMSLDQVTSMDVDTSKVVVKNPIAQPTLSDIILNRSLSDKDKIGILTTRIMSKNGSIRERSNGCTLLMLACENSGIELAEWLLQQDKDLLIRRDSADRNVLFYAASYANKPLFYYFLERQPSFATSLDRQNLTTLHAAAAGGDIEIFSVLLKRQNKPWPKEFFREDAYSILYCAASRRRFLFIQWLAREHIEFMVSCENIQVAINNAKSVKDDLIASFLQTFLASKEWCNYLIKKGLHNKPCRTGFYPIHYFAAYGFLDSVELLLDAKVTIDLQSANGRGITPLYLAAKWGYLDMVMLLVRRGVNLLNKFNGWHPIHAAAEEGRFEVVDWLLSQRVSANLTTETRQGSSIMHVAVNKGHLNIVKLLYEHKAEINKLDNDGDQPVHIAAWRNRTIVLKWLLEQKGVSPDKPRDSVQYPDTPLLIALENGHFDLVEVLKAHNAKYTVAVEKKDEKNPSQDTEPNYLEKSLLLAAARDAKALPILKNLLTEGVSINAMMTVNVDGKNPVIPAKNIRIRLTALDEAIRHNNIEGVKFLLEKNPIMYLGDSLLGGTFALAILSGNVDIFQLLFSYVTKNPTVRMALLDYKLHDDNLIYKKPFPKEIFFILRKLLMPAEMANFAENYLVNFYKTPIQDESLLYAFIDLIKQDRDVYLTILHNILNTIDDLYNRNLPSLLISPILLRKAGLRKAASLLLKQILVDEKFFPLLTQNNHALLIKIVRFSKNKEMLTKLLVRMSFNKDFNLMHALICEARGEGAAAILESLPDEKRKELISHNNYAVFDKIIQDGGIKTFFSLLKELKDPHLENQLIRKHLKFGMQFILTAENKVNTWFKRRLSYFLSAIPSSSERDKIIFETLHKHLCSIKIPALEYLINWTSPDKRRNLILSLTSKIDLLWNDWVNDKGVSVSNGKSVLDYHLRQRIDALLSRLDKEEDRELFLLLIYSSSRDPEEEEDSEEEQDSEDEKLSTDFLNDKTQLVRAAAVNKLYQIQGFEFWMVTALLEKAKLLYGFMLTSKNKNFPRLNEDLSLHILTILTGLPPSLIKVVMQAMHIDGIKAAKAKGIIKADAKLEEKEHVYRYYSNSTLFFQRMAVCMVEAPKKTVQKSSDEKMSLG